MPLNKSGNAALIDLQFLPCIAYFATLTRFDNVIIDQHEHFVKQTYRNRCHILGANGIIRLTIPVAKGSQRTPIKEVAVDFSHTWLPVIWKSILSSYGKSPFFEYFADDLKDIFYKQHQHLFQLNIDLLSFCLKCLQLDIQTGLSEKYLKKPELPIVDMRGTISPKKGQVNESIYTPFPYNQVFGNKFAPNLSIIDLIFCEGPNARDILNKSTGAD